MNAGPDDSVITAFAQSLAQLWARDGIASGDVSSLALTVTESFAAGEDGVLAASALMAQSGVRDRWNETLRHDRADALARRIIPLLDGSVLDVLSGDGSVCRALSAIGIATLSATERIGDYGESVLPSHVDFHPFTTDLNFSQFGASTALLSAVLHHETNPAHLLDALAAADIPRWIVIENCVTAQFSRSFHQFADQFFNTCLNECGIDCVEQHRTLDEWTDLLSAYGTTCVIESDFAVPGIPFPYSLLVVDRDRSVRITRHLQDQGSPR